MWEQYEAMPHIFFQLLDKLQYSSIYMENSARFCHQGVHEAGSLNSRGTHIEVELLRGREIHIKELISSTVGEAAIRMHTQKATKRVWTDPADLKFSL